MGRRGRKRVGQSRGQIAYFGKSAPSTGHEAGGNSFEQSPQKALVIHLLALLKRTDEISKQEYSDAGYVDLVQFYTADEIQHNVMNLDTIIDKLKHIDRPFKNVKINESYQ